MPLGFPLFRPVTGLARAAAVLLVLAAPGSAHAGEAGPMSPVPQPDPLASARTAQRQDEAARQAHQQALRQAWLEWQLKRGGSWRDWLRTRSEAERRLLLQRGADWLARQQPAPRPQTGTTLGERLNRQWRQQRDAWEDEKPGLRPHAIRNPLPDGLYEPSPFSPR